MAGVPDPSTLSTLPLFRGLSPGHLSSLKGLLHLKECRAGAPLIVAGSAGEVIYIILEGAVKISLEQKKGTSVTLALLGAGDTVGEMSTADNSGRSADVVTLEDSKLLWMSKDDFQRCLREMPEMACNLIAILSSRLRAANEHIRALASLEMESRVARQLLALAERFGRETEGGDILIPVRITQGDLACLVGASRERINQIIVSYKERRYISSDRHHYIVIHNRHALLNRCE
ncbi:MAG TPA: Crp/Fnr family transcriptional regulator [Blastocatellia bacterium]|nr:Crp/Fnr family transcriptional regulator [Blastocatellia bacterium]